MASVSESWLIPPLVTKPRNVDRRVLRYVVAVDHQIVQDEAPFGIRSRDHSVIIYRQLVLLFVTP